MKKVTLYTIVLLFFFSCQKEKEIAPDINSISPVLSSADIDDFILDRIKETGTVFDWKDATNDVLFSAAMKSDSIFAIGYQPVGFNDIATRINTIDLEDENWKPVLDKILNFILKGEKERRPNIELSDLLPFGYPKVVPNVSIKITNKATVVKLREMPEIRFLEAMGYALSDNTVSSRNIFGCNGAGPNYDLDTAHYTTIEPLTKQSWHHSVTQKAHQDHHHRPGLRHKRNKRTLPK